MKCLILALVLIAIGGTCDEVQVPEGVSPDKDGVVREGGLPVQDSPETPYRSMPDGGRAATSGEALDEPTPTPKLAPPTPVPDVPEPTAPVEAETATPTHEGRDALDVPPLASATQGPAGTLVSGVQLTVYSCVGDSTGAYCPWGNAMYSGQQVHRGAAACGWQWPIGQRFRIVGDPYEDMIYTCLDRGGAVTGIDIYFYDWHAAETQAWRNALPQFVSMELLP